MPDSEGFFVRWWLALMGSMVNPDEEASFKLYMYMQNYIYICHVLYDI